jgi:hypothetical protein
MSGVMPEQEQIEMIKASKNILERLGLCGTLNEVIVDDTTGKVLSGSHRKSADPNWPEKHIRTKNELERQLIILHSNFQRVVKKDETQYRLMKIAQLLEKKGVEKHTIASKMVELVPYSQRYIQELLPAEYKEKPRTPTAPMPALSPTQLTCKRLDEGKQQVKREVNSMVEAFMPKDNDRYNPYPYENCACKGCEHENNCAKLLS